MTRQEEIIQAAIKEYPRFAERQVGFITGAKWVDQHPHWISVEDELPPITYTSSTWLSTDEVLVLTAISGTPRIGRFEIDRLNGGAYWLIDGKQYADFIELDEEMMRLVGTAEKHQRAVTHWMPLPSVEHLNKK